MSVFVDVDARMFAAAAVCASTEDTRSYLCGVRIERHPVKGALLVATDGHRIMVVYDAEAKCNTDVTVALPKEALRLCALKGEPRRITIKGNGVAAIGTEWKSSGSCFVDGTYPEWHGLVPIIKWSNEPASFRGKYLGDFGKIAEILYGRDHQPLRMSTQGAMDPALILFPNVPNAFGILMPMRADVGAGVPIWMKPAIDNHKQPKSKTRRAA